MILQILVALSIIGQLVFIIYVCNDRSPTKRKSDLIEDEFNKMGEE
jgi:hypothetical protein